MDPTSSPESGEPVELPGDLIELDHACRILGVSGATLRKWIAAGKVTSYRAGKKHRVSENAIRRLIRKSK